MPLCEKLVPIFHDLLKRKKKKSANGITDHRNSMEIIYRAKGVAGNHTLLQSRWDNDETLDSKEKASTHLMSPTD